MTAHGTLGAARVASRALGALSAYLLAWRAFSLPGLVLVAWWVWIHPAFGLGAWLLLVIALVAVVGALADHGKGFSVDALVRNISDACERTRRRHATTRTRRRWSELCRELGWDTADGRTPTSSTGRPDESRRQKPRQPALRHVEHLGDTLRIAWRPRGDVNPKQWREHAEALRRQLHGHSVRVAEDPREPGTLVATIGLRPLPAHDAAPGPVDGQTPAPTISRESSAVQQAPTLAVELGQRAGGGIATWRPAEVNGLLVVGATGGGKGGCLRYIAHQVLDQGAVLHVIDPKGTGEYGWVTDRGGHLHRTLERQVDALRVLAMELRGRCDDLAALGAASVSDLPPRLRPQPIVVVVDEAADLFTLRRVPVEKATDELRSEAGSLATVLAQQGRAVGIHPVVALQRPDVSALGPAGGALRAQLVARVVTGTLDEDGCDQALGNGHRELLVNLTGHPGRALVARLAHADGAQPYSVQVRWLPLHALRPPGITTTREEAA